MKTIISLFLWLTLPVTTLLAQEITVNILSYNVHNCIGMDKARDYQRIANVIKQQSPDVVAVLELDSVTTRNEGVFALQELEKLTQMHGVFASAIPYQGGSYGIGILSKEQPLSIRTVPMPGREEKRTMIIAEFKDYVFCATHQSLTGEDQLLSIPLIKNSLEGIKKPIFLAGDMNSQPSEKPQQELNKLFVTLNDTAAYTFPADQPDCCIDYIYGYKKNGHKFQILQQKVIDEKAASDHRPVKVTVRIK